MEASWLSSVPFIHPMIAGAAVLAGAIPVLVHLMNRRRYRRVSWAAMGFLQAAHRRSAKRVRLEQFLLLFVRVLLITLLGLAIARPFVPANALAPLRSSRVHRILLIDNSLSMNAVIGLEDNERTRFALAVQYAGRLLNSFPRTDGVSLVTLAAPAEAVIAYPAYDRRFVRERLGMIQPTQRASDAVGAIDEVLEILGESSVAPGNQVVYLLSGLARHVWHGDLDENADAPPAAVIALRRLSDALGESGDGLHIVAIALCGRDGAQCKDNLCSTAACPMENVAVTRLAAETPLLTVHLPVRIVAEVTNTGSSTARNLALQVRRDGQIIRQELLPPLDPGQSKLITLSTTFSKAGTHAMDARVTGLARDALPDDDVRYLSIEVRETTPVLLVDGRPGATLLTGQAGFLALALAPERSSFSGLDGSTIGRLDDSTPVEPKVVTVSELSGELLSDYDVVALCNVERLTGEQWRQLETYVSEGGGLMIFGGDRVNTDQYNRYAYADGAGLLPGRLGRSISATGAASLGFQSDRLVHPIVAELASQPGSGVFLARIERYLPIKLDAGRAEVVLQYTNGDPALTASTFGKGHVLLCTTTANLEWTNLPAKGDFVSIMFNAVAYLSKRHGDHRNVMVGQEIRERLSAVESSLPLRVTTAGGAAREPSIVPDGEALRLEYGPVERAGVLTVSLGSHRREFAVNVDPTECDVTSVDPEAFRVALDRPCTLTGVTEADWTTEPIAGVAQRSGHYTELAAWMLYAVLGLLLLEPWLAMRFGFPKPAQVKDRVEQRSSLHSVSARRVGASAHWVHSS